MLGQTQKQQKQGDQGRAPKSTLCKQTLECSDQLCLQPEPLQPQSRLFLMVISGKDRTSLYYFHYETLEKIMLRLSKQMKGRWLICILTCSALFSGSASPSFFTTICMVKKKNFWNRSNEYLGSITREICEGNLATNYSSFITYESKIINAPLWFNYCLSMWPLSKAHCCSLRKFLGTNIMPGRIHS